MLKMFWDEQGKGRPLLLLHPGFNTIESSWSKLRPLLSPRFRTIAFEQQGHGRTPDLDRPLRYEQMVEDTAALMRSLELRDVDVFGWSDGGIIGLGLALKHPSLVRRLAICGSGFDPSAEGPEFKKVMRELDPARERFKAMREAYERVAPDPGGWPRLVEKTKDMYFAFEGWPRAELEKLKAPLLVMRGDRDFVRLEHVAELVERVPEGTLAVLPDSDHGAPVTRAEWIAPMLMHHFAAPSGSET